MTINGFFSYSRIDWEADQETLCDLVKNLEAQARAAHGSQRFSLWRDELGLRWGEDWRHKLHQQINKTNLFFVLLSPAWIKSPICREELSAFLEHETAQRWSGRVLVIQIRDIPADDSEIDAGMWQMLAELDKRQAKRWSSLLNTDHDTRRNAFNQAGKEIAAVLRSFGVVRAHPSPPPTRRSLLPVSGQPLVSGDFYAPSQAKVNGHQSVMLNLVFAGQCKVSLGKKGRFVFGVHAARLHIRADGGGHMLTHPDFDVTRCAVAVECTSTGKRHRNYQIIAREEPLRGSVLAIAGDGDHVPLLLIDREGAKETITVSGFVQVEVECVRIDWDKSSPKDKRTSDEEKVARMQQAIAQLILNEQGERFELEEVTLCPA
jgi:hypothetical protein